MEELRKLLKAYGDARVARSNSFSLDRDIRVKRAAKAVTDHVENLLGDSDIDIRICGRCHAAYGATNKCPRCGCEAVL